MEVLLHYELFLLFTLFTVPNGLWPPLLIFGKLYCKRPCLMVQNLQYNENDPSPPFICFGGASRPLHYNRVGESASAWQRRWEPSKGPQSRSRTVYTKLESTIEPERARISQRVAVRASKSQREAQRESVRATGNQSELETTKKSHSDPEWVKESPQAYLNIVLLQNN